jgi:hypothetical protein
MWKYTEMWSRILLAALDSRQFKNSLKRRALPSFGAASKRAFVLALRSPICRRNVVVGATPRM